MKRQKLNWSILMFALVGLLLTSCQDEEATANVVASQEIDLKSTETEAELDNVSDESSAIIEEAYLTEEFPETKSTVLDRYLPDCVVITKVITQNNKEVTIDFGDGCELRNGNVVKGKIILVYEKDTEAATKTISFAFDSFVFNDKNVEGSGSILRERSNENGNPQSTRTGDVTVTWLDGSVANKNGTKIREWIEGYGTGVWGDNVFLITGNWMFTKKNGTVLAAKVVEPLRRELACKFLVSGIVEVTKNENNALLNYGEGDCDSMAIVSINGGEDREIDLSSIR
jgi:hypothetical protein